MLRPPKVSTHPNTVLRVATYNIHKGVRGMGPQRRLEIHNLVLGIEALDADLAFLQEVRSFNHGEARRFPDRHKGWPRVPQADYLAPEGYQVAYRTNAITKGPASTAMPCCRGWPLGDIGHHDVSDHRFEQRGLLHVPVDWNGTRVHAIVAHLGLIHASRVRQVERIQAFIADHVPPDECLVLAGDFNDWAKKLDMPVHAMGLRRAECPHGGSQRTFPSRLPVFALDRIYTRGLKCNLTSVPRGAAWPACRITCRWWRSWNWNEAGPGGLSWQPGPRRWLGRCGGRESLSLQEGAPMVDESPGEPVPESTRVIPSASDETRAERLSRVVLKPAVQWRQRGPLAVRWRRIVSRHGAGHRTGAP